MDVTRIYLFGKEQHVTCSRCPGAFWEICPLPSNTWRCSLCTFNPDLYYEAAVTRRTYARWI